MEEDADQIVQLQSLTTPLYAVIARLRHEIVVWRERDRMARISLGLLNRTLVELDRSLYATRVAYNNLHTAHENLLSLYNHRNNI